MIAQTIVFDILRNVEKKFLILTASFTWAIWYYKYKSIRFFLKFFYLLNTC